MNNKIFKIILAILCAFLFSISSFLYYKNSSFFYNFSNFKTPDSINLNIDSIESIKPIESIESTKQEFYIQNIEKMAHSSSMVDLNDKIMIVFFAGDREGAKNTKIYQSFYNKSKNTFDKTIAILDKEMLEKASGKYIKKLGNPLIFKDNSNNINLFVVGVSLGGWATSKIYHFRFNENLVDLEFIQELHLSPFANLSHLVRTQPILLEKGFILPIYHEIANKYPLLAFFDENGKLLFTKKFGKINQLQPSIIALNQNECLSIFRSRFNIFLQKCKDNANSFEEQIQTNIDNYDSSLILLNLNDKILAIHNEDEKNGDARDRISLSVLKDIENGNFKKILELDFEANQGVSYPSALVDSENLYTSYTYKNQIKFLKINLNTIYNLIKEKGE